MAEVKSGSYGSSPEASYILYADQTGGSGNSRTIKLKLLLKVKGSTSTSKYGYPLNWIARIHNSYSGEMWVKGNDYWYATEGYREYTWTATVDVESTSAKDITVGFQTKRSDGGSTSWNYTTTATFRVGNTNTPPWFSSGEQWLRVRAWDQNGDVLQSSSDTVYYPENVSSLHADWGYASDNEGGTITYILQEQVNHGGWSTIDTGTDRAHGYSIGAGNEGQQRRLWVTARDSTGAQADSGVYCKHLVKNTLTAGWFTGHSNDIGPDTTEFTLYFNKGSNVNGSKVVNNCYSHDITVHNQQNTSATSQVIKIWRSGNYPSEPYIKFNDIKNYVANKGYTARLHVGLGTHNDYGTSKHASGSIGIDLRTNPNGSPNAYVWDGNDCWKTVNGIKYMIPENNNSVQIDFQAGSGRNGESVNYEIYYSINNGNWTFLRNGYDSAWTSSGNQWYTVYHSFGRQTYSGSIKYLIRTKTSYGYYTDKTLSNIQFHYYHGVVISPGTVSRTQGTAEVNLTVKTTTSIPNMKTIGRWECYNTGLSFSLLSENPSGYLTESQSEQTIKIDRLFGEYQHNLKVWYNDNTGLSGEKVYEIRIPAFAAAFFVNKYGVGVNGAKANSSVALNVSGGVAINGITYNYKTLEGENLNDIKTDGEYRQNANVNTSEALNYPENLAGHLTVTTGAGVQQRYHVYNTSRVYTRAQYSSGAWTAWAKQYNTLNKPTASDIGALANKGNITYDTQSSSASSAFNFKGTNTSGKIWCGTGGVVLQSNDGVNLHLGRNSTTDMVFQSDAIEVNKYLNVKNVINANVVKIGSVTDEDANNLANEHYLNARANSANRPCDWSMVRNIGRADDTSCRLQLGWHYGSSGNKFYMRSQHDQSKNWYDWERLLTTGWCKETVTDDTSGNKKEGYVQLNDKNRLFFGWFTVTGTADGWGSRKYVVPNCTELYEVTVNAMNPSVGVFARDTGTANEIWAQMYSMESASIQCRYIGVGR